MDTSYRFWPWFLINWSRPAVVMATVLLALAPFARGGMTLAAFLVFLQLPVYMIHQYEEHAHGAFKAFVNREVGRGKEVLSDAGIVWINIGGVWALNLIILYLTAYLRPSLALVAIYLSVVNGLLHLMVALATRRYNPGLVTSVALFLPVGIYSIVALGNTVALNWGDHVIGIGFALLLHIAIVISVLINRARLSAPAQ